MIDVFHIILNHFLSKYSILVTFYIRYYIFVDLNATKFCQKFPYVTYCICFNYSCINKVAF